MTSPAQIERNLSNAKLSTGPRTAEGKNRSRMNALKHGLTARTVLLPDEKPAEFRWRMNGWFKSLEPQDHAEVFLAERVAICSWHLDRVSRARSAQTYLMAHTGKFVEQNRVELEVTGCSQILFRAPYGRPVACPAAEMPDGEGAKTWQGKFEAGDHPALVIKRMEGNGLGCLWLRERWEELGVIVERGASWRVPERFRAFRLLGIHAIDAYMTAELASLLQACGVLDPTAGSLVSEIWNELVSADDLAGLEEAYQQQIRYTPSMDEDSAREHLLTIVTRQTARLEEKARQHEQAAEIKAELAPHLQATDLSPEGRLMLRYEFSWEKLLRQNLEQLKDLRSETHKRSECVNGYLPPSPRWFAAAGDADDSADLQENDDHSGLYEGWRGRREYAVEWEAPGNEASEAGGGLRNEANEGQDSVKSLRNEANEAWVDSSLRNEANDGETVLRNEANAACGGMDTSLRNEANEEEASIDSQRAEFDDGASEVELPLRITGVGYGVPERFEEIMAEAMRDLEERPRPGIALGTRRDSGHGQTGGGSRRGRRQRKKQESRGV
jgi:hypothetical protein